MPTSSTVPGRARLPQLPVELLLMIAGHVSGQDSKALRLVCRVLASAIPLCLRRIFLTSRPFDIAVFLAVASHDVLRHQVRAIVWDDVLQRDPIEGMADTHPEEALAYGLLRLPALVRITVTHASHMGHPQTPFMRMLRASTPGTDEKPVPPFEVDGRDTVEDDDVEDDGGGGVPLLSSCRIDNWKGLRLALSVVADRVRASCFDEIPFGRASNGDGGSVLPPVVAELVLGPDAWHGISHRLFAVPAVADNTAVTTSYANLCTVLGQPSFRRLDLCLAKGARCDLDSLQEDLVRNDRPLLPPLFCYDVGTRIHDALAVIGPDLETLRLATDMMHDGVYWSVMQRHPQKEVLFAPLLRSVLLPPGIARRWPRLRHFALGGVVATRTALAELLAELPATLCVLELRDLCFLEGAGNGRGDGHWHGVVDDLRTILCQETRPSCQWRVSIRADKVLVVGELAREMRVSQPAMDAFLRGNGANPFGSIDPVTGRVMDGNEIRRSVWPARRHASRSGALGCGREDGRYVGRSGDVGRGGAVEELRRNNGGLTEESMEERQLP